MRKWIQNWLGIANVITGQREMRKDIENYMEAALSAINSSAHHAGEAQRWASVVASSKGLPRFADVSCPMCERSYSHVAIEGHRCSIICHCGAHLEVSEAGEVSLR